MCVSLGLQAACVGGGAATALILPAVLDDYTDRYYIGLGGAALLGAWLGWSTMRSGALVVQGGVWSVVGWHVARHFCNDGLG